MITKTQLEEIIDYTIEGLEDLKGTETEADEVHQQLFNTDYYIIGTAEAKKWLEDNVGVFEAINEIQEYEKWAFGETYTDITCPEKVVNMYVYIKGEEILQDTKLYDKYWNKKLDDDMINEIINQLN
jgi:hypothetical protein